MIAWDALGIAQHHDSMPGTMSAQGSYVHWHTDTPGAACNDSSCMVLEDYTQQLAAAQTASQDVLELSLQEVTTATAPVHLQQTGTDNTIIVYNPLAYDRDEIVAVDLPPPPSTSAPSSHKSSSPSSSSSPPPASDVWPAILDCNSQLIIAQASSSPANRTVYFRAQIPALGHALFFIDYSQNSTVVQPQPVPPPPIISNYVLEIALDAQGNVHSVLNKVSGAGI